MKDITQPALFSPSLVVMLLLAAAIVYIGLKEVKVPLLSSLRVDIFLLLVIGMAMCTQGIGRVAAAGQWSHPLSILGYVLGALIIIAALVGFFGWKLFFIQTEQHALLTMAVLIAVKIAISLVHALQARG